MSRVPLVPRTPVFQNGGQVSGLKPFLDFICKLEGWKTKCKNLHWAAPKKNVHVYLDEFLEVISDYQDTVAEGIMGVLSVHLGPNDVKGDPGNAQTAQQFVDEVKAACDYTTKANNNEGVVAELIEKFIFNEI